MQEEQTIKRVKNIAAMVYLLVMVFLLGGSWWHQQHKAETSAPTSASSR